MIGVLDYGMGNIRSIANAIEQTGNDFVFAENGDLFDKLSHLIIPGVGHFQTAMQELMQQKLEGPIRSFAQSGRPLLGICLGMQLLATVGTEGGRENGLALIPATVKPIPKFGSLRIPHVGWNTVSFHQTHPIVQGIKDGCDFYFVHSFAMQCDAANDVMATTDYGDHLVAVVGRNNIIGFQFHPEKSQINGLQLIENFCGWDGQC